MLDPIKSWSTTRVHMLILGFVISCCRVIPLSRVIQLSGNMWPRTQLHRLTTMAKSLRGNGTFRLWNKAISRFHFFSFSLVLECFPLQHTNSWSLTSFAVLSYKSSLQYNLYKVFPRGSSGHTRSTPLSTLHYDTPAEPSNNVPVTRSRLKSHIVASDPHQRCKPWGNIVADAKLEIEFSRTGSLTPFSLNTKVITTTQLPCVCRIIVVSLCVGSGQGECQQWA